MMTVQTVKLGDVAKITTGKTPSKSDKNNFGGRIPFVKPPHLGKYGFVMKTEEYLSSQGQAYANIIPQNSVMVSCIGSLGKVGIAGVDLATNQQINSLTFDAKKVDYKYGYYFCLTLKRKLDEIANKAVVPIVNKTTFSNLDFLLPPLETQKRIVARLDAADQLRRKRKQAIALLDDYLKAVFLEMFGDPVVNPKGWEVKTLGEMLGFMTSGSRGWAKYYAQEGDTFLRIQNVGKNELKTRDICYVQAPETAEAKRTKVEAGDVLLSITADLGRTAVIPPNFGTAYINQHLAILRLKQEYSPDYVSEFLASNGGVRQIERLNKGGTKAGLNFNDIRSIQIPIPDKNLQDTYIAKRRHIKALKVDMSVQMDELENNFNALMQGAFNS